MLNLSDLSFQDLQSPRAWALMRARQPVCRVPQLCTDEPDDTGEFWAVATRPHVEAMLKAGSNKRTLAPVLPLPAAAGPLFAELAGLNDDVSASGDRPGHTRFRVAHEWLMPYRAAKVRPYLAGFKLRADTLAISLRGRHQVDLVNEFAAPLSLGVVAVLLGLPEADLPQIRLAADGQITAIWGNASDAERLAAIKRFVWLWKYCKRLVAGEICEITEDSFIARARRWEDPRFDKLTDDEIASLIINDIVAGYETSRGLQVQTIHRLLTQPRYRRGLQSGSVSVRAFVQAVNLFDPSISGWLRVATDEPAFVEAGIPVGARVLLLLGSANRDFPGGDIFSLEPPPFVTLAFGHPESPHDCIGRSVALAEVTTGTEALFTHHPDLVLAPEYDGGEDDNLSFRAKRKMTALGLAA